MKRLSKEEQARAHLCTHPGCERPWTSFYTLGKVCGEHARPTKPVVPIPTIPPQPHWQDDRDGDPQ